LLTLEILGLEIVAGNRWNNTLKNEVGRLLTRVATARMQRRFTGNSTGPPP
jgi:hypothetical protein